MRFVVAITAASGAIYARLTIERLLASPCVSEIALVCSRHAREVMAHEGVSLPVDTRIREYANDDMFAPPASGSARGPPRHAPGCRMALKGRLRV